jgi:hypothetical protein
MSLTFVYGVLISTSSVDAPNHSSIKDSKKRDKFYESWIENREKKMSEAFNYDEEIKMFGIDFENSEDLQGAIIGIELKTLTAQYSGAMDITNIGSKVTDEIKTKIKNMVMETNLLDCVKSLGRIWTVLKCNE